MQPKEYTHMLFGVNDFTMAASQTQRDLTEACMIRRDFKSCGKSLNATLELSASQHFHKLFPAISVVHLARKIDVPLFTTMSLSCTVMQRLVVGSSQSACSYWLLLISDVLRCVAGYQQ